jgi:hypothetical protein
MCYMVAGCYSPKESIVTVHWKLPFLPFFLTDSMTLGVVQPVED